MTGSESERWKISPEYAEAVNRVGESILRFMEKADDEAIVDAKLALLADGLPNEADGTGYFKVLSKGRKKWEGHTLAGALTAAATGDYDPPVRVVYFDEDANRIVVLTDEGEADG